MNQDTIIQELQFKAVCSSGAGGQHVNKVSTKIELFFDLAHSKGLSQDEKERIYRKLGGKITKDGIFVLHCDESRSQHKNKARAIARFFDLIKTSLKRPKIRRKTKPHRSAVEKRLKRKKNKALKKANRRKPDLE